jgi:hypothetical protein
MNIDYHFRNLRESISVIEDCIEKGLVARQRNIGFNVSAACADMLEIYLHKLNLIDMGFMIKHEWLKSKNKITEKFPFEFKNKNEIFYLMFEIERKRNDLCYGRPQKEETIIKVIEDFNKLRRTFKESGIDV